MTTIEDAAKAYLDAGTAIENILEHYGVPGMKWGVRKSRTRSADAERHGAARKKHVSELSDKELKDLVNRMNMEQQAKRLNPSVVGRGNNYLKASGALLGTVAGIAAFTQSRPGKFLEEALKRKVRSATSIPVGSIGRTR